MQILVMMSSLGMRFCLLLLLPMICSAKTMELGFPGLEHRIKVVLPEGHDPAKKYPAILYYHGTGGKPDTDLMLHHTGGQPWIVVGMSYYQLGKFTMTPETMAKELTLLRSVKRHLHSKYGMDAKRCYVAGFSKGGWMADLFLQADPSLAGGVILGAGHLHKYRKKPLNYGSKKPVFVGVGRLDGNYPFGLNAVLYHRKAGAQTTLEVWSEVGHSFPRGGSEALMQWLALRSMEKLSLENIVQEEIAKAHAKAFKRPEVDTWYELKRIKALPYARLLDESWKAVLAASIKQLELLPAVKKEAAALRHHNKLVLSEIKGKSLESLARVHSDYQKLADSFAGTKQAKLAEHDCQRTAKLMRHFQKQKEIVEEKKKEPFNPVEPKLPETGRGIPRNPLVR